MISAQTDSGRFILKIIFTEVNSPILRSETCQTYVALYANKLQPFHLRPTAAGVSGRIVTQAESLRAQA